MQVEASNKPRFGKWLRNIMKNAKRTGKSARRGNAPAPYTKYHKAPYQYMFKRKKYKDEDMGITSLTKKAA